ncbi:hypothetical protein LEP1GSC050_0075 [Leptospira phage vB_LbrZ_5399-LE1]|uniref:Uncharacterized protein n=1 Tax=Leptospira inadai serovar Lyme TaxID=293084 RepID=A0ABX4YGG8_9LEPT|nr:hypothetical protein LEP1GSC050_0075 [Leptospira phage vB_LbrZ_5399-LE1]PNV74338.1 hypothetical protein BES34_014220 [Leptospira inadai serovar Lyme]
MLTELYLIYYFDEKEISTRPSGSSLFKFQDALLEVDRQSRAGLQRGIFKLILIENDRSESNRCILIKTGNQADSRRWGIEFVP